MKCCQKCVHLVIEDYRDGKPLVWRCTRHKDSKTDRWYLCEDAMALDGPCGPDLKSFEDGDEL